MFELFVQPSKQATLHHHDQLAQLKKIQSQNRKIKAGQPGKTEIHQICDLGGKPGSKTKKSSKYIDAKAADWIETESSAP